MCQLLLSDFRYCSQFNVSKAFVAQIIKFFSALIGIFCIFVEILLTIPSHTGQGPPFFECSGAKFSPISQKRH